MINRAQPTETLPNPGDIRDAVRAWAAVAGQDVVAAHIVDHWRNSGGQGIEFSTDVSRARQKLFRCLDNRFDTEEYEKEVAEAKRTVLLDAPKHQKLKEISEGIVSMFRLEPDLAGPLMAMVTTMLGGI